jgi:hypothetical protein
VQWQGCGMTASLHIAPMKTQRIENLLEMLPKYPACTQKTKLKS